MQTTVITAVMQKIQEAAKQAIPKISVDLIPLQKAVANFVHQKTPEPLRCFSNFIYTFSSIFSFPPYRHRSIPTYRLLSYYFPD